MKWWAQKRKKQKMWICPNKINKDKQNKELCQDKHWKLSKPLSGNEKSKQKGKDSGHRCMVVVEATCMTRRWFCRSHVMMTLMSSYNCNQNNEKGYEEWEFHLWSHACNALRWLNLQNSSLFASHIWFK